MNRSPIAALLVAAALPVWAAPAANDLFPLDVGRSWTYRMTVQKGAERQTIEYTTEVVRTEPVDDAGEFAVLESRSKQRLLHVARYKRDGDTIVVAPGGASADARTFLDLAAAKRVLEGATDRPTWSWKAPDGKAEGTVTLAGTEALLVRNVGTITCLVVEDTRTVGGARQRQERRLWLAPGVGLVKETMTYHGPQGALSTEAVLTRHSAP